MPKLETFNRVVSTRSPGSKQAPQYDAVQGIRVGRLFVAPAIGFTRKFAVYTLAGHMLYDLCDYTSRPAAIRAAEFIAPQANAAFNEAGESVPGSPELIAFMRRARDMNSGAVEYVSL